MMARMWLFSCEIKCSTSQNNNIKYNIYNCIKQPMENLLIHFNDLQD